MAQAAVMYCVGRTCICQTLESYLKILPQNLACFCCAWPGAVMQSMSALLQQEPMLQHFLKLLPHSPDPMEGLNSTGVAKVGWETALLHPFHFACALWH